MELLSQEERRGLNLFTGEHYNEINGALFGKKTLFSGNDEDSIVTVPGFTRTIKAMDSAFASSPLKERIVYRGKRGGGERFDPVDGSVDGYVKENYAVGSEVIFDGYQSTSLSPSVATDYAFSYGIVFEMKTKTGINVSSESTYSNESEVLLPRASRWKVLSVKKHDYKVKTVATSERCFTNVTVVQMVEIDEDCSEITERATPPALTPKQLSVIDKF